MFERFSKLAEQTTNSLSRRKFLGKVGEKALPAVALLGAFFALPNKAQAQFRVYCCTYRCKPFFSDSYETKKNCRPYRLGCSPSPFWGQCTLTSSQYAGTCSQCN